MFFGHLALPFVYVTTPESYSSAVRGFQLSFLLGIWNYFSYTCIENAPIYSKYIPIYISCLFFIFN